MKAIKLQEQMVIHDPDNGIYGDCFRATLATLLGLNTEDLPHFLHDNCGDEVFNQRVGDFLAPLGLAFMSFKAWDFAAWKKACHIDADIYHDIADDSPRFAGVGHSVVGKNGEVFHDPHPTKMGLPTVTDNRTFGFLVQVAPKHNQHSELLAIHNICMCIAECPPIQPEDTYTVRAVKEMAYRLVDAEKEIARLSPEVN